MTWSVISHQGIEIDLIRTGYTHQHNAQVRQYLQPYQITHTHTHTHKGAGQVQPVLNHWFYLPLISVPWQRDAKLPIAMATSRRLATHGLQIQVSRDIPLWVTDIIQVTRHNVCLLHSSGTRRHLANFDWCHYDMLTFLKVNGRIVLVRYLSNPVRQSVFVAGF